ncbi:MAG: carboxypeptidase regulatory-like domain-containing protein, partial [Gemmatimonadetes bacterium]|nr:carboxypeptidase regulatory-like domain-containing protein [Gemmatimonadota bacterium]
MSQSVKVALVLAALVMLLPGSAFAQQGNIAGTVRDSSGGIMPGVLVEVTSPALIEKVRTAVTDANGQYRITSLPVGTYSVTFTLEGFTTVRRDDIVLTTGFTAP